ncbi:DUF2793 domain-containing protein [Rhizobium sp. OAE497]|uniref:DUF2793 domain-containing protein n=1 Tax=Rhizobium sp. OAE497 TaxID=2663796 RepID=UPI0018F4EE2B
MSDMTVNLALPYILPSQAQKHVTHNEALQLIDAVTQLTISAEASAAPEDPAEGACYLVSAGATGTWSGKDGRLAFRQDGAWIYILPRDGWRAYFAAVSRLRIFAAGVWSDLVPPPPASLPLLGLNASADAQNRLAVASPASLFNHEGHGHQVKVNKASAAETASLLFQSNWSGRAEMGLAGNDEFAIKVSGDGSAWETALAIAAGGIVKTPARPVARGALAAATTTPGNNTRTGFNALHVQQGGFSLGAAVPSGSGNRLTVPASGLYLLILSVSTVTSSAYGARLEANGSTALAAIAGAATTVASRQTAFGLAQLAAGDWLSILHTGTAQYKFGAGETEISAILL